MKQSLNRIGLTLLLAATLQTPSIAVAHEQQHDHMKAMPAMVMENNSVVAEGVINQIVAAENKLKISHEPIKAWNMGAMRMSFHLAPGVDISGLKEGQRIKFMLENPKIGTYLITKIMAQ
ncbi:MAG: copper-binding protein [Motiliproteus sp.]